jgi:cytoskeleton protein RodZ
MSNLGNILREERERKGLSLHEVGLTLKISPKILKAIEDGDEKSLPAKTFVRGFVKSYASFLKLDVKSVLEEFNRHYRETKEATATQNNEPSNSQSVAEKNSGSTSSQVQSNVSERVLKKSKDDLSAANQTTNKTFTFVIAGGLLIAIAFVAKVMDKYKNESNTSSQAELIESLSTTSTLPVLNATAVSSAMSQSAEAASIVSTGMSVATSASGVANSQANLVPATTTTTTVKVPAVQPIVTTTTLTTTTTTTTTSTTNTSLTTSTTTTLKAGLTEVIIEALNQVKIRFTLNGGQKWETIDLAADKVHTFRSRTGVELEISDGGAVNVIVNGRDRGVPGVIGKPTKLVYPK